MLSTIALNTMSSFSKFIYFIFRPKDTRQKARGKTLEYFSPGDPRLYVQLPRSTSATGTNKILQWGGWGPIALCNTGSLVLNTCSQAATSVNRGKTRFRVGLSPLSPTNLIYYVRITYIVRLVYAASERSISEKRASYRHSFKLSR